MVLTLTSPTSRHALSPWASLQLISSKVRLHASTGKAPAWQLVHFIQSCMLHTGLYRNRMQDVRRLLESRHAGCYKVGSNGSSSFDLAVAAHQQWQNCVQVYNLCIEDGYGYDASLIGCPVERLPIYDGQVRLLPNSLSLHPTSARSDRLGCCLPKT